MSIHSKFKILNLTIFVFFVLGILTSYELFKGAHLIELNFNHTKYNHVFFDNVLRYEKGNLDNFEILRNGILDIKQQPIDCLKAINAAEHFFMKIIGTDYAIDLCIKDIEDADRALTALEDYRANAISQSQLFESLNMAIADFKENSNLFEPLVKTTVYTLFTTLVATSIVFAICVFVLVTLIARAIRNDYSEMQNMSQRIQKLASFPEKNPQPIVEINEDLEVTYANPAFREYFPNLTFDQHLKNELSIPILNAIDKTFETRSTVKIEQKVNDLWFLFNFDYIKFENESVVRVFGHNMTARKVAENELVEVNAELEEFAYRTSHDLRAPIVSSIKILEMAQGMINDKNYDSATEGIDHASKSLQKLKILIDDIIQLTVIRNKEEEDEEINLNELVDTALAKLSNMEGRDRITVKQNYKFKDIIKTKKLRVQMILENMVSNAIKYYDPEKSHSFIDISTYKDGLFCVVEVSDNGLGIPEDQQKNLFKMFKRFHPKAAYGSGLGLYLMKKSADIIGASIEFKGLKDGSSFKIRIPT